jgi:hypothetical protein
MNTLPSGRGSHHPSASPCKTKSAGHTRCDCVRHTTKVERYSSYKMNSRVRCLAGRPVRAPASLLPSNLSEIGGAHHFPSSTSSDRHVRAHHYERVFNAHGSWVADGLLGARTSKRNTAALPPIVNAIHPRRRHLLPTCNPWLGGYFTTARRLSLREKRGSEKASAYPISCSPRLLSDQSQDNQPPPGSLQPSARPP